MSNRDFKELPAFLDEAIIYVEAGKGGDGMVHFCREKFRPRGGPDGGTGGRGGSVILKASVSLTSLLDFTYTPRIKAPDGQPGGAAECTGAQGEDVSILVPEGTQVFDAATGDMIADLRVAGSTALVARGGRGGRGNAAFKNPVQQAPRLAEKGEPGEAHTLRLELKLLADVGLVGLPNAGKSTLISRISRARPKIAGYPFTTLVPNLGVVKLADREFVVADLPGLIEGASQGAGLGHDFLRHLERCGVMLHVVDISDKMPDEARAAYETLQAELVAFNPSLDERPRLVALNKFDLWSFDTEAENEYREAFSDTGMQVFCLSAVTGRGVDGLVAYVSELVQRERSAHPLPEEPQHFEFEQPETPLVVEQLSAHCFRVQGGDLERFVYRIDMESRESLYYLHKRLQRLGIIDQLRLKGAREGDTVQIGEFSMVFTDLPGFE